MSYTNHDVIHAWANWSPLAPVQSRRSSNGNCSFHHRELYSYSTCIAKHVSTQNERRGRIVLVTTRTYSVTTTGKHMPRFNVFPAGVAVFHVNNVLATDQRENYRVMLAEIEAEARRLKRARRYTDTDHIERLVSAANDFRAAFGIRLKAATIPTDLDLAELDRKAKQKRARQAKRLERERREREKRQAIEREAWLAGAKVNPPASPLHFRVIERDGEKIVESTMGARVPLRDALKVARLAHDIAANGHHYTPRLSGVPAVRVGDFSLDSIDSNGTVTIGCHTFTLDEINRAAQVAGVSL